MRVLSYLLVFCIGLVAMFLALNIGKFMGPSEQAAEVKSVDIALTYTDFVTIMFTGATLVLTALAVFIGIAAVYSFQGLKREAHVVIKTEVNKRMSNLDDRISKEADEKITAAVIRAGRGGQLDEALEKAIIAIGQGDTKLSGELENDFDPDDDGER